MKKAVVTTRDLRIFGFIWGLIFAVISYKSEQLFLFAAVISVAFFFSAAACPGIYLQIKFYQNWVKFGNVLGKINGFLISFILFYGVFAPTGIILKLLKKDLLSKKLDASKSSYFIDRVAQPSSMKNQF